VSDLSQQDALLGVRLGTSQIERPLGAGAMSTVYLARQERPRRSVAIKVVRRSLAPGRDQWPIFLGRFRREADAMAALDHANITPIYEFGEQDDLAYLVMPYLPEGSLADALERQGPLHVERAVAAIEQVAAALDYAHQHGIIHRDVKPSNVLIHPDGRLLLSDFGIARPLDQRELPASSLPGRAGDSSLTMAGAALGTPDYMAPEQIRGDKVSPATDIYALGALAYTLLAGRPPFRGGSAARIMERQLNDAPHPLRLDRPDVPSRMEEAIFWALAKDPADRPESAGALAKALRAGLRSGPLAAGAALLRRAGMPAQLGALAVREPTGGSGMSSGTTRGPIVKTARMDPSVIRADAMEPSAPDDATIWDARYSPHASARNTSVDTNSGGAPIWPTAPRRAAQSEKNGGVRLSAAFITAIGAALIVLLVTGVMLGSLLSGGDPFAALVGPHTTTTVGATYTATTPPTPTASPSPTAPPDWLVVTPASITLGCSGDNRTQQFELSNQGDRKVGWQASADNFASGISISPRTGTLHPNQQVSINVTNNFSGFTRAGQITITPNSDSAGAAAVVSYTIDCNGGGQGG
jgi:hypothetical protein